MTEKLKKSQDKNFFSNISKMPFHHDIEDKIRFIVVYQDVSKKPTVIQKYTKIGLQNIQRWIKDTEENINILERRPGSGRRPSIPDNVKSNIARTTRRKPSKSSTRSAISIKSVRTQLIGP